MVVRGTSISLEPKGLVNKNNNCFFNAVIQSLLSSPKLCYEFLNPKTTSPIRLELQSLVSKYQNDKIVNPIPFLQFLHEKIELFDGQEQDAHELLVRFLALLSIDAGGKEAALTSLEDFEAMKNTNVFCDLFSGMQKQIIKCTQCSHESFGYEEFSVLSLPVHTQMSVSFQEYCLVETIQWRCNNCKELQSSGQNESNGGGEASRSVTFEALPQLLGIHLRRFTARGKKDTTSIAIAQNLVMDTFEYALIAIVQHAGNLHGGHYTAVVRRRNRWYYCDDTDIRELPNGPPADGIEPYILLYQHVSHIH